MKWARGGSGATLGAPTGSAVGAGAGAGVVSALGEEGAGLGAVVDPRTAVATVVVVVVAGAVATVVDCLKIMVTNSVPSSVRTAPTPIASKGPRMFLRWLGEFMKAVWRGPGSGPIPTFSPRSDHPDVAEESWELEEWKIFPWAAISLLWLRA